MDVILWIIVAAFIVWELYAHFVAKNKGEHTLSNRIQSWEKRWPYLRIATLSFMLVLTVHLVTGWF